MNLTRRLIAASALIVVGVGGACSSDGAAPARSAAISLRGLAFSPAEVTTAPGGSVTWTNDEEVDHTVTAGTPDVPDHTRFHKALLNAQTFKFTFEEPGSYPFFCERHPANMQGKVTVR